VAAYSEVTKLFKTWNLHLQTGRRVERVCVTLVLFPHNFCKYSRFLFHWWNSHCRNSNISFWL